jgi:hypothetical protein
MNSLPVMMIPLARHSLLTLVLMAPALPAVAQTPDAQQPAPAAQPGAPPASAAAPTAPATTPATPDPKAQDVLKQARAALGGDAALAKIQSVTVTGSARRTFGEREMTADVTLDLLLPDKYKRTEDVGIQGGPSFTRVSAVNGTEVWDDATNRGGGAFRFGGPGGPGGPGGGSGNGQGRQATEEDRQRFRQAQERRMRGELARFSLIWFLKTDAPVTYAGVAEAPDGKADVLEVKPADAPAMKLFVDQSSHRPLMLTYEGMMPRFAFNRGGQRPTPEEIEKMRNTPPQQVTFEVHFSDYKKVEGVQLPHTITQGMNGTVNEEFTIDKYKLNAPLKPEQFVKKGS